MAGRPAALGGGDAGRLGSFQVADNRTFGSRLKYGFWACDMRNGARTERPETGLSSRFFRTVLDRPRQQVRREEASRERIPGLAGFGGVNRSATNTPANLPLSAAVGLSESGTPKGTGGEGGIRTHGTVARTSVFETDPFDRSGTSPRCAGRGRRQGSLVEGSRRIIISLASRNAPSATVDVPPHPALYARLHDGTRGAADVRFWADTHKPHTVRRESRGDP